MSDADKLLVVYHANCMDGFCAAWVVWQAQLNLAEYYPAQYGTEGADVVLPDVNGRNVLMVDFCTGREQLMRLHRQARSLLVIDHHKTAEAVCGGLEFCRFDMERSGAGMTWDHLHPGEQRPWPVAYVEDRDLWRFALPDSKAVNAYLSTLPHDFYAWQLLSDQCTPEGAAERGKAVLAYIDRYVRDVGAQARLTKFGGYSPIPIVNAPYVNTSELVGHLAGARLFAVGWFQRADGLYQYSLRSRGDFDVSELAKHFGGGGHKGAAGFASAHPPDFHRELPP